VAPTGPGAECASAVTASTPPPTVAGAGHRLLQRTGVTAGLAAPLAEVGVPIFVLATFDTDYLLVQAGRFDEAITRLRAAGHRIADSL
jgi:hypothetical protein